MNVQRTLSAGAGDGAGLSTSASKGWVRPRAEAAAPGRVLRLIKPVRAQRLCPCRACVLGLKAEMADGGSQALTLGEESHKALHGPVALA